MNNEEESKIVGRAVKHQLTEEKLIFQNMIKANNINISNVIQNSQVFLIKMRTHVAVDNKLSDKTRVFLHEIGLRNSEELGFNFTGETLLLPNQVVGFEEKVEGRVICLDIKQGEMIRWYDDSKEGFVNSSVEQFVLSVEEYESYIHDVQAKEIFGPFYSRKAVRSNRAPYAEYLTSRLKAIDPVIFDSGYYWPAFIERIESGL